MSQLTPAPKGLLFCSLIYADEIQKDKFLEEWIRRFGAGECFYPTFNPSFDYYSKEMGLNLKRLIYFSFNLHHREQLIVAKIWGTKMEQIGAASGKRKLNIDPGLLTLENMLLSTGKPYVHRIYLGEGVYADLNYIYQNGSYQPLNWTYPDYAHSEKIQKFNEIRKFQILK